MWLCTTCPSECRVLLLGWEGGRRQLTSFVWGRTMLWERGLPRNFCPRQGQKSSLRRSNITECWDRTGPVRHMVMKCRFHDAAQAFSDHHALHSGHTGLGVGWGVSWSIAMSHLFPQRCLPCHLPDPCLLPGT